MQYTKNECTKQESYLFYKKPCLGNHLEQAFHCKACFDKKACLSLKKAWEERQKQVFINTCGINRIDRKVVKIADKNKVEKRKSKEELLEELLMLNDIKEKYGI